MSVAEQVMFKFRPVHLFDYSSQQLKDRRGQITWKITGISCWLFELNYDVSQHDWWFFCFGKGNRDQGRHGPSCFVLNKLVLCKLFRPDVEHVMWKLYCYAMVSRWEANLHVYYSMKFEFSLACLARTRLNRCNQQKFIHSETFYHHLLLQAYFILVQGRRGQERDACLSSGAESLKELIAQVAYFQRIAVNVTNT